MPHGAYKTEIVLKSHLDTTTITTTTTAFQHLTDDVVCVVGYRLFTRSILQRTVLNVSPILSRSYSLRHLGACSWQGPDDQCLLIKLV